MSLSIVLCYFRKHDTDVIHPTPQNVSAQKHVTVSKSADHKKYHLHVNKDFCNVVDKITSDKTTYSTHKFGCAQNIKYTSQGTPYRVRSCKDMLGCRQVCCSLEKGDLCCAYGWDCWMKD